MDTFRKRPVDYDDVNGIKNHQRKRPRNEANSVSETASNSSRRQTSSTTVARQRKMSFVNNLARNHHTNNRPLSMIESLPADLLENIFIQSVNVNLPRASPYLAAAVSNERVYRLLILLAFWDDTEGRHNDVNSGDITQYKDLGTYPWREDRTYNIPYILRPLGHDYVPLSRDARANLQSGILEFKWCTSDRIRKQLPDVARLIITRHCVDAGYVFGKEEQGLALEEFLRFEEEAGTRRMFTTTRIRKQPEPESISEDGFSTKYPCCRFTVQTGEFVTFSFEDSVRSMGDTRDPTTITIRLPLLSLITIPPFLFRADANYSHLGLTRGCFTDAHLTLLNTVRYSNTHNMLVTYTYSLAHDLGYSGDALRQGINVALSTINPRALDVLLKYDRFFGRDDEPYHTLPSDYFRTAAQMYVSMNTKHDINDEYRDDSGNEKIKNDALLCFCLLLTSSAESIPYDDPVITQLAKDVGGAFGDWLSDLTVILPEHKAHLVPNLEERQKCFRLQEGGGYEGTTIFRGRRPCTMVDMGERYLTEVMPTGELFKVPERWVAQDRR